MSKEKKKQVSSRPISKTKQNKKPKPSKKESVSVFQKPSKTDNNVASQRRPPSKAAFVWLFIFVLIGLFFVLKSIQDPKKLSCDQTTFEKMLTWGYIKTATVNSETDRLMAVEGTYSFEAIDGITLVDENIEQTLVPAITEDGDIFGCISDDYSASYYFTNAGTTTVTAIDSSLYYDSNIDVDGTKDFALFT
jgi:hypothetical protein